MKPRSYRDVILDLLYHSHRNGDQPSIIDITTWIHDANYHTVHSEVRRLEREGKIRAERMGRFKPTLLHLA